MRKQQDLAEQTAALLCDVRRTTTALGWLSASPAALQRRLELVARQMMNRVGVTMVDYLAGIRFARNLSKPFRTLSGQALADELERQWRLWTERGMEPGLPEVITFGLFQALTGRPVGAASPRQVKVQTAKCKCQDGGQDRACGEECGMAVPSQVKVQSADCRVQSDGQGAGGV